MTTDFINHNPTSTPTFSVRHLDFDNEVLSKPIVRLATYHKVIGDLKDHLEEAITAPRSHFVF